MHTTIAGAGFIGLAAVIGLAAAQNTPPPGRPGGPMRSPIVAAIDADGDGVISAAEIAGAPAALKTLDANHDGQLTPEELRPVFARGGPDGRGFDGGARRGRATDGGGVAAPSGDPAAAGDRGGRGPRGGRGGRFGPAPIVLALDADHDGVLSAAEIDGAAQALKALDANGDGSLTRDEFGPPLRGQAPGTAGR